MNDLEETIQRLAEYEVLEGNTVALLREQLLAMTKALQNLEDVIREMKK